MQTPWALVCLVCVAWPTLTTGTAAESLPAGGSHAPTGPFKNRVLEQSAAIGGGFVTLCIRMRNTGADPIYLTSHFRDQLYTSFTSPDGRPDVPERHTSGEPMRIPPPLSTNLIGYYELEERSRLETCGNYKLDDFEFETVHIQSEFTSWLRFGDPLPDVLTKYTHPEDLPLTSGEPLYSNVCVLDRKHKTVTCR